MWAGAEHAELPGRGIKARLPFPSPGKVVKGYWTAGWSFWISEVAVEGVQGAGSEASLSELQSSPGMALRASTSEG